LFRELLIKGKLSTVANNQWTGFPHRIAGVVICDEMFVILLAYGEIYRQSKMSILVKLKRKGKITYERWYV